MATTKLADVSFACSDSLFSTNITKISLKTELSVKILYISCAFNFNLVKFSSDNSDFINVIIDDKTLLSMMEKEIIKAPQNIGYYVILNNGTDGYGLLTPTADSVIWCIRLLSKDWDIKNVHTHVNVKDSANDLNKHKTRNEGILELADLKSKLLGKNYDKPSNLIITESLKCILDESAALDYPSLESKTHNKLHVIAMNKKEDEVLKVIDPVKFLADKYLLILYNKSTLLEHFVKSSIPKMHLLRRDDIQLAKDSLRGLIIGSIIDFDKRHSIEPRYDENLKIKEFKNRWLDDNFLLDSSEKKYRNKVLEKLNILENVRLCDVAELNDFLDQLKVKDLKLQLLLSLEYLKLLIQSSKNTDNHIIGSINIQPTVNNIEVRKPVVKRRLVGKRKRLIPTLLGTVIPESLNFDADFRLNSQSQLQQDQENKKKELSIGDTKTLINSLFDKLCVWDAIMDIGYKDLNSSWGFLTNCIIPYYQKFHKQLIEDMAVKCRGTTIILRKKTKKDKEEKKRKMKEKEKEKEREREKVKQSKKQPQNIKKIERISASIDLSQVKLKRSYSSFNSTVDLSKKTFDMVKSVSSMTMSTVNSGKITLAHRIGSVESTTSDSISRFTSESSEINNMNTINNCTDNNNNNNADNNKGFMNHKKRKLFGPNLKNMVALPTKEIEELDNNDGAKEIPKAIPTLEPQHHFVKNQIIEETPRKPKSKRMIIEEKIPMEKLDNHAFTETQILETPRAERVEVKKGIFEISSSPLKSDQPKTAVIMSSPEIFTSISTQQTKLVKNTKRKLNFE